LIFRQATADDIELIASLAHRIWKAHYPDIITQEQIDYMLEAMYSRDSLLRQMKEDHAFTLAYEGADAIGFLSVSKKQERDYFIHKFYIDSSRQKRGIGKALFTHVLSLLNQPKRIELTVNRMNYKAINFYFKLGFAIERCEDFDIGSGYFMNDFVMRYGL